MWDGPEDDPEDDHWNFFLLWLGAIILIVVTTFAFLGMAWMVMWVFG